MSTGRACGDVVHGHQAVEDLVQERRFLKLWWGLLRPCLGLLGRLQLPLAIQHCGLLRRGFCLGVLGVLGIFGILGLGFRGFRLCGLQLRFCLRDAFFQRIELLLLSVVRIKLRSRLKVLDSLGSWFHRDLISELAAHQLLIKTETEHVTYCHLQLQVLIHNFALLHANFHQLFHIREQPRAKLLEVDGAASVHVGGVEERMRPLLGHTHCIKHCG
mmetsp:Transcript_136354/g.192829  ORF Transcript_136354/g.192829 Transcript_136354/m.192829 type:complete len:216 (-) Transcript_136354:117-764(-)